MGGASLRDLIAQLIEDGKAYATAELAVVKATVNAWVKPAKVAVPLLIVALFLLQAALFGLVAALGLLLARWIGLAGGFAVSAVLTLAIAGALVGIAISKLSKAGK